MTSSIHSTDLSTAAGRADAERRVHAALAFAHGTSGRATLAARRVFAALGPFGTVLLALYPVVLVMGFMIAGCWFSGHAGV